METSPVASAICAKPSATRAAPNAKQPRTRSAVSNGSRLFVVRPGDTAWSRRFSDVLAEIIGDLGGPTVLSEGQRQLARRCATIAIACERMEGDAVAGAQIDLEIYGTLTDRLGRTFQRLGLKRQPRDITTLDPLNYAAARDREV